MIFVFFEDSFADLITETRVNIIPNNKSNCTNFHHHDTTTLDVTPDVTFIVSVIAKNDVVIINKNKKFINELLSLPPK